MCGPRTSGPSPGVGGPPDARRPWAINRQRSAATPTVHNVQRGCPSEKRGVPRGKKCFSKRGMCISKRAEAGERRDLIRCRRVNRASDRVQNGCTRPQVRPVHSEDKGGPQHWMRDEDLQGSIPRRRGSTRGGCWQMGGMGTRC